MLKPRKTLENIIPYTPGKSIEQVKQELGLDSIIKLASNENPLGPAVSPNQLEDTINSLHRYPDIPISPLLDALASHYGIEKSQIILGNGSDEVIQLLALSFLNPGEEVLTSEITFSEYEFVSHLLDARIKTVPMDKYRYSVPNLINALTPQTKLVFIANPNNPTGTYITHQEVETLLEALPKDAILVLDEAYAEYVDADDFPDINSLITKHTNVIALRTFSKIYGLAGLRIGYGLASQELIQVLDKARQPFNLNSIALKAAQVALSNTDHIQQSLDVNRKGKAYLEAECKRLGLQTLPSQTNFLFISLPKSGKDVYNDLLKNGIIVRNLASFGVKNAIRVTIGTQKQNELVIQSLESSL